MKNFGKFMPSQEDIIVEGTFYQGIVFYRNEEAQDLVDVLRANSHAFYIAVDEIGRIISMESDPEHIQLGGYDIIGIDGDFGFSRGEGGTVYGAIWDGTQIVAPPVPVPVPVPDLTARQFWQAALVMGITEEGLVASVCDPADALYIEDEEERLSVLVDIRKAGTFRRDYPLIDEMAAAHDLPPEQMDALWAWAAAIE